MIWGIWVKVLSGVLFICDAYLACNVIYNKL